MRIAIYDTDHFETTFTLVHLLNTTGNQVTLLVSEDVAAVLRSMVPVDFSEHIHWQILPKTSMRNSLRIYRICRRKKIQAIFFGTVSRHHLFFGILCRSIPDVRKILTIYDANSFFKPVFSISPRGLAKWAGIKLLAGSVDGYATLLSATKFYIDRNFNPGKKIFCVPSSFYDGAENHAVAGSAETVIVIPGSVDVKRRNYNPLFEALSFWCAERVSLEIVLLGGATTTEGAEVIRRCNSFATKTVKITTYEEAFVSQQEYERQLRRCDFIYAPLQTYFREESMMLETYGLTKSSGCFFDAIRFAKPLLLSTDISLPDEIAPQTLVHKSTLALAEFISSVGFEDKRRYQENAIRNARRFTLPAIRNKIGFNEPEDWLA